MAVPAQVARAAQISTLKEVKLPRTLKLDAAENVLTSHVQEVHLSRFSKNKKGLENQGLLRFLAEQAGFEPAVGY